MKLSFSLKRNKKPKDIHKFFYNNVNPERDWHIILLTFLSLSLIGAVYGAYMFYRFENHVVDVDFSSSSNSNDIGTSRLHTIVSDYREKENKFEAAQANVYNGGDPSLP